jgi:hypothetical protein
VASKAEVASTAAKMMLRIVVVPCVRCEELFFAMISVAQNLFVGVVGGYRGSGVSISSEEATPIPAKKGGDVATEAGGGRCCASFRMGQVVERLVRSRDPNR